MDTLYIIFSIWGAGALIGMFIVGYTNTSNDELNRGMNKDFGTIVAGLWPAAIPAIIMVFIIIWIMKLGEKLGRLNAR